MPRADSGSLGTPIRVARGSGRSAPRDQTEADVVAGATTSSAPPDAVGEVDALRAQGQHRLGADVDEVSSDGLAAQLATEPVTALEHRDGRRRQRVEHPERGSEAGDPATHDDDPGPGCHGRDGHGVKPLTRVGRARARPGGTGPSAACPDAEAAPRDAS